MLASCRDARRVTLQEVAEATGINRSTLSKILNQKGYSTGTDVLDRLCTCFGCSVADLLAQEGLLRASGDGPPLQSLIGRAAKVAPRERRWTLTRRHQARRRHGCSARAEMDPRSRTQSMCGRRLLRVSGDGPKARR